ncbi:MAG: ATP-dependent Clp protease adaptor ClpS [Candidatus Sumerlaeales bacterium]|nr:ATP-dependent Clp protease adaptor ClpS [Candidatus Sumerlaeales bacterium]
MNLSNTNIDAEFDLETLEKELDGAGEGWAVYLHNDDDHEMVEVTNQLMLALDCDSTQAWRIMMKAHTNGVALVIITGKSEAEKIADVLREIKLKVDVESVA